MDNNPVYDKLKSEILKEVQPLIDAREAARQRMVDLRQQVKDWRSQAAEAKAELKTLDTQLTQALIDSPDKVAGIQKKIQRGLQTVKDLIESGDRLEKQLPAVDAETRNRENAVSIAVSQKVLAASQEYSKLACQHFLDLLGVYLRWIWAVNALRTDLRVSGLDGLHSHRLHIRKAVETIPDKDKVLWHRVTKNIASDFGSLGSFFGDI